jgi:hypothetical protein
LPFLIEAHFVPEKLLGRHGFTARKKAVPDGDDIERRGAVMNSRRFIFSPASAQINLRRPAVNRNSDDQRIEAEIISGRFGRFAGAFKTHGVGAWPSGFACRVFRTRWTISDRTGQTGDLLAVQQNAINAVVVRMHHPGRQ